MKISGFTIVRNAINYDFPIVESIHSLLNFVDEMIIVLGESEDDTAALINNIESDKIKIINTVWDTQTFNKDGNIYAQQTELGLRACTGDWCMYIQADEVFHEDGIEVVKRACKHYLNNKEVEGFIFKYVHFYATYERHIDAMHFAYPREIRMVRNHPNIHSWKDAQSFRWNDAFDGINYFDKEHSRKLNCIELDAYMYHYGWSRDPRKIGKKVSEQKMMHDGIVESTFTTELFDYGNIANFPIFKGSHPEIMADRIKNMDWENELKYSGPHTTEMSKKFKWKYRVINFIENKILNKKMLFGFKNYNKIGTYK